MARHPPARLRHHFRRHLDRHYYPRPLHRCTLGTSPSLPPTLSLIILYLLLFLLERQDKHNSLSVPLFFSFPSCCTSTFVSGGGHSYPFVSTLSTFVVAPIYTTINNGFHPLCKGDHRSKEGARLQSSKDPVEPQDEHHQHRRRMGHILWRRAQACVLRHGTAQQQHVRPCDDREVLGKGGTPRSEWCRLLSESVHSFDSKQSHPRRSRWLVPRIERSYASNR